MDGASFCQHHYRLSRANVSKNAATVDKDEGKDEEEEMTREHPNGDSTAMEPPNPQARKRRRRKEAGTPEEELITAAIQKEEQKNEENPIAVAAQEEEEEEMEVSGKLPNGAATAMPLSVGSGAASVPEQFRCRRTDGRQWRCPLRAMDGVNFCQHHYRLWSRSVAKSNGVTASNPAGASPKVSRNSGRPLRSPPEQPDPPERKRRRRKKDGAQTEELVTVAIQTADTLAATVAADAEGKEEAEVMRKLPNGVMTISPAQKKKGPRGNAGSPVDLKLGLQERSLFQRRFRSKNAEPVPVATLKVFPRSKGLGCRRRKRACHRCGEKKVARMIRCSSCRKGFFCSPCIEKWLVIFNQQF